MSNKYRLRILSGPEEGQIVRLSQSLLCIGRGSLGEKRRGWLSLADNTVSRHHANLHWLPAERSYLIEHLSYTNATWVNGKEILGTALVGHGAKIQIGHSRMVLEQEIMSISLGAKVSLPPEPKPVQKPLEPPFFLQLLPSGSQEPLKKEQPNVIGHGVSVRWDQNQDHFFVDVNERGSALIHRNCGDRQEAISVTLDPVILESGDILTVDFCQFRYGESDNTHEKEESAPPSSLDQYRIPGYSIVAPLGQGASGDVLHMKDRAGKSVAVKFLKKSLIFNKEAQKRFSREIKVALTIDHPYLLKVIDAGQTLQGQPYLVSELLQGETLAELITRTSQFDFDTVVELASDLGAALSYLHTRDLIHRDVKPDNIFIQKGRAILMDYGIVRGADLTNATATGFAIGTPYYMAPEQFRGFTGPNSDQYALAGVLFQLLAGRHVFESTDVLALAYMHVTEKPPRLSEFRTDLPSPVCGIIDRMLSKAPDARFPTVNDAIQALQRAAPPAAT